MLTGKHLIAGEWVAGDATFLSSPATGEALAFAVGTPAHVDRAVQAAIGGRRCNRIITRALGISRHT